MVRDVPSLCCSSGLRLLCGGAFRGRDDGRARGREGAEGRAPEADAGVVEPSVELRPEGISAIAVTLLSTTPKRVRYIMNHDSTSIPPITNTRSGIAA